MSETRHGPVPDLFLIGLLLSSAYVCNTSGSENRVLNKTVSVFMELMFSFEKVETV